MASFAGLLAHLRARLDSESVPFVIGGSFALAARGHPRLTDDIDVMVMCRGLAGVQRAMTDPRYERINEVTFRDLPTSLLVDLIPVEDDAQRHVFDSATLARIPGGAEARVLTAEGCCLMLLREATLGDKKRRPLRLRDIELLAMGALDWSEIRAWARRMRWRAAYRDVVAEGKPAW